MEFTGRGDFLGVGREFLGHFIRLGGLQPRHAVLDVGCGMGRMAVALTGYLDDRGGYRGLDIVPSGITWCQSRITSRFPRFQFQLADVHNDLYNKKGRFEPEDYRFPFEDASFDFVYLCSVFTHMGPAAVRNYLREIARVLKPSAQCFITWYFLDEEARRLIADGRSTLDFRHPHGEALSVSREHPEYDIAFSEGWIRDAYREAGLSLLEPIHPGYWSGKKEFLSSQDILIARKP
jgi:SAM-dependent methyltransferase